MQWLAKIAGLIAMTLAIVGLAVAIVFPIAMAPDPSWPFGYLIEAVFGLVLGVGLGLGGYWLGAGRFLPEHDRWSLPVAALIVGGIIADCTFFVYAMLVNRDGERPTWAIVVFVAVLVLVVIAVVVHQVLYATAARRELGRWPATPTTQLTPGMYHKVVGVIQPVGAMLQLPVSTLYGSYGEKTLLVVRIARAWSPTRLPASLGTTDVALGKWA